MVSPERSPRVTSPSIPTTFVDLRDHPLQRDHWWGSSEFVAAYGSLSINEIIARIGADFGVVGDFSAPVPLESRGRPDAEGLVLFVTDADGTAKRWPPERWVELATTLGRRGLGTAVVTRGGGRNTLVDRGLACVVARDPRRSRRRAERMPRRRRGRYGSDAHRCPAGNAHRHPFPDAGRLFPGLGPYPPRGWVGVRSGVPTGRASVRLQPASGPELGATRRHGRAPRAAGCLVAIEPSSVLKSLGELC